MPDSLDIAVLPGDGIGREVMDACLELLAAAERASGGPRLALTKHPAGALHYKESGEALPAATLEAARWAGRTSAIPTGRSPSRSWT
jgi:3-isopropylmalate dehydrogenase